MFVTTTFTVFAVIGGVLLLGLILNVRAVKRFFTLGKAKMGEAGRWAVSQDPVAMYREKIDEAVEQLRIAKHSLIKVKSLITQVERQVQEGKKEEAQLDARIKIALKEGNEVKAADYVKQLQSVQHNLVENQNQLDSHKETYNVFLKQVQSSQAKVEKARKDAERLGAQLEISKAESELSDIQTTLLSADNSPLNELGEYRTEINRQIDRNRAKGIVAGDLNATALEEEAEQEKVRELEATAILEQYKQKVSGATANGAAHP